MNSRLAAKPSEGVYYALPRKAGGVQVVSLRADQEDEPLHMFFWPRVLRQLGHDHGVDLSDLETNYGAVPRGRIQKELDQKMNETGGYIVLHGGDVPLGTIKPFVLQDFGLIPLAAAGRVKWVVDAHEKTDPADRELLQARLK